ncbi:hypothetical protein [Marimonas arenosa]|uniref:Group 4 capsule polysaccharide lipoprotein GfcB/YjbF n=1 Tax=Marimonas arenosa TaxID=1795305 RepID=A0AAE3W8Y7_9RHOB|nr:hypothetical protein [Marimonas arenosa]MDQ2088304.1 hypothetical protein [Marimonas arenosa]
MSRPVMRRFLVLLPLLMPATASASCPSAADLDRGVVLVQNGTAFRRADFERTAQGLMEVRHEHRDGRSRNSVAWYAHGLASRSERVGDRGLRTVYRGDVSALDRLDELGEVTLTGEVLDSSGGREQIALRVAFLGRQSYTLAECRYDSWHLRYERITPGGKAERFELDYAPALGLVLAAREIGADGAVPVFAYTWIGTKSDVER